MIRHSLVGCFQKEMLQNLVEVRPRWVQHCVFNRTTATAGLNGWSNSDQCQHSILQRSDLVLNLWSFLIGIWRCFRPSKISYAEKYTSPWQGRWSNGQKKWPSLGWRRKVTSNAGEWHGRPISLGKIAFSMGFCKRRRTSAVLLED